MNMHSLGINPQHESSRNNLSKESKKRNQLMTDGQMMQQSLITNPQVNIYFKTNAVNESNEGVSSQTEAFKFKGPTPDNFALKKNNFQNGGEFDQAL